MARMDFHGGWFDPNSIAQYGLGQHHDSNYSILRIAGSVWDFLLFFQLAVKITLEHLEGNSIWLRCSLIREGAVFWGPDARHKHAGCGCSRPYYSPFWVSLHLHFTVAT